MRLTLQNHIVCADYGQVHLDARVVGQIIDYTAETWQPDRPKKERECNIAVSYTHLTLPTICSV